MTDLQKSQANKILSCYNNVEDSIEKGGEGSRGGKVIGHTKSGKPVYEHRNPNYHSGFEDFTKQDHQDAAKHHKNHALFLEQKANTEYKKGNKDKAAELAGKMENHKNIANHHDRMEGK